MHLKKCKCPYISWYKKEGAYTRMTFAEKVMAAYNAKSEEEMKEAITKMTDLQKDIAILVLMKTVKKHCSGLGASVMDMFE